MTRPTSSKRLQEKQDKQEIVSKKTKTNEIASTVNEKELIQNEFEAIREKLEPVVEKIAELEKAIEKKQIGVRRSFIGQLKPLYEARDKIISENDCLWGKLVAIHPTLNENNLVLPNEINYLVPYLKDVEVNDLIDDNGSYSIKFTFSNEAKDHFQPLVWNKTVIINNDGEVSQEKSTVTQIEFKNADIDPRKFAEAYNNSIYSQLESNENDEDDDDKNEDKEKKDEEKSQHDDENKDDEGEDDDDDDEDNDLSDDLRPVYSIAGWFSIVDPLEAGEFGDVFRSEVYPYIQTLLDDNFDDDDFSDSEDFDSDEDDESNE